MARLLYLKNVVTLKLNKDLCNGCTRCIQVCPHHVFKIINNLSTIINRDACMECGACALNCQSKAIYVDSGVGCADAIIKGYLNNTEPTCDCVSSDTCC